MAEIDDLSGTDANNTGRWPENMAPSAVNDGGRALEGMIARFFQDLVTGDAATLSGSKIQVTANRTSITLTGTTSNYRANLLIGFTMGANPITGPVRLDINGIGPISLRDNYGSSLSSSVIKAATRVIAVKDNTNNYFRMLLPYHDPGGASASVLTTRGDLLTRGASALARLAVGSSGQYLKSDGTDPSWVTPGFLTLTEGTEQASTSGTAINFTSIPSGTKRITIQFVGVSTNGISNMIVQIGDSGGYETSGYLSAASSVTAGSDASTAYTDGFGVSSGIAAAAVLHGAMTLTREDSSNNTWVCVGILNRSDLAFSIINSGSKSLSAELDRLRITMQNGTDAFDAGAINIQYEWSA